MPPPRAARDHSGAGSPRMQSAAEAEQQQHVAPRRGIGPADQPDVDFAAANPGRGGGDRIEPGRLFAEQRARRADDAEHDRDVAGQ